MHQYTYEEVTNLLESMHIDHSTDPDQTITLLLTDQPEDIAIEIDPTTLLYHTPLPLITYVYQDAAA